MIVKSQKTIELLNTCNAIYEKKEVVGALVWLAELYGKPVARLKKVFMHGKYPAISVHGDKIHLHRALGMYWWRDSDYEFDAKYVHHINGNKLDARKVNLRLVDASEHQSHHTKGRVFTAEHRAKISEGNRNRWRNCYPNFYENSELLEAKDAL